MLKEIFDNAENKGVFIYKRLCDLHKPCSSERKCSNENSEKIVDFDSFKDKICQDKKIETKCSVDAIAYKNNILFFIEIKSDDYFNILEKENFEEKTREKAEKIALKYNESSALIINFLPEMLDLKKKSTRIILTDLIEKYIIVCAKHRDAINEINQNIIFLSILSDLKDYHRRCIEPIKIYCEEFDEKMQNL